MNQFWSRLLTSIERQGLSFMLMALMAWYFHVQNDKLQAKVDDCNSAKMEQSDMRSELLQTVIQENTRAFDRNTRSNQEIMDFLNKQ